MHVQKAVIDRCLTIAPTFLIWAARELGRKNLSVDRAAPLIDIAGKREPLTVLAVNLGMAQRFALGADGEMPFLGAQHGDLDALISVQWSRCRLSGRDDCGNAWVRLTSVPFRIPEMPLFETGLKPVEIAVPVSPRLIEKIPVLAKSKHLALRRIKVGDNGEMLGIGTRNHAVIPLIR